MTERVDVCIVGSGFGGSISAFRLAELYRAAGQTPSIVVLERGRAPPAHDFRQSMDIEHLSDIYGLIQGQGAPDRDRRTAWAAARTSTSPRRCARRARPSSAATTGPTTAPTGACGRRRSAARTLDPYYARAEQALRVQRPTWNQVSKSGGLWAATLDARRATPATACRSRSTSTAASSAKWCHTGCIFGAKNSVITNYLASAERTGRAGPPAASQAELIRPSRRAPYRYVVTSSEIDNDGADPTRQPDGHDFEIECKVLILAAGAMGTPPLLMRSQGRRCRALGAVGQAPRRERRPRRGDRVRRAKVRDVLGLPGYGQFYKGKHDHDDDLRLLGRAVAATATTAPASRSRRSSSRTLAQRPLRRRPRPAGDPSWWGLPEEAGDLDLVNNHIEILAMVEDTNDGEFLAAAAGRASHVRPNAGPLGVGLVQLPALRPVDARPRGGERGDHGSRASAAGSAAS